MRKRRIKSVAFLNVIAIIMFSGCHNKQPLIIAHRGASATAPENTVAAVVAAFEMEADGIEVDVHLTKDKRVMVLHDKTTKRTTGIDMDISENSSSELRELDAGKSKSAYYAGQRIPFIEEIVEIVPENKKLFIEIKCGREILPYLEDIIENSSKSNQIVIISFNEVVLSEAKRLMPRTDMYWLNRSDMNKQTGEYLPYNKSIVEYAVERGFEGISLHYRGLSQAFVEQAENGGLEVHTWTVNDTEEALEVSEMGVKSITTNCPDQIRNAF